MHQNVKAQTVRGRLLLAVLLALALRAGAARAEDQAPTLPTPADRSIQNATDDEAWQYPTQPDSDWVTPAPALESDEGPTVRQPRWHRPFRHMGIGQPLEGTSWLNRPWYAEIFAGSWFGDTLVPGHVEADTGFFSGLVLGNDLSHYWGCELRLSLAYIDVRLEQEVYSSGEARTFVGDINVLYYPWGDAKWRPYGSLGLGIAGYHFVDLQNRQVDHTGASFPIGLGVKYLLRNWLAIRIDLKDTIIFGGNDIGTTGNWSLTGGLEVHWGGETSARYFPW